jgi:hypothetical protein
MERGVIVRGSDNNTNPASSSKCARHKHAYDRKGAQSVH